MLASSVICWRNKEMTKKSEKLIKKLILTNKIFISSERLEVKSSGKMWLLTILKFIKNQGFTLSLKDSTVGGGRGGTTGGWSNWPTPAFCRLRIESPKCITSILVKDWDHFIFPSLSFLFSYDPSHDPQLFEKNIFEVGSLFI